MLKDSDAFGPLPEKPAAVFRHPSGGELYDWLAMDLHAMKYAEQCVKEEREACAKICEEHPDGLHPLGGAFVTCAKAIRARGDRAGDKTERSCPPGAHSCDPWWILAARSGAKTNDAGAVEFPNQEAVRRFVKSLCEQARNDERGRFAK